MTGGDVKTLARNVALKALEEFSEKESPLTWAASTVTKGRVDTFVKLGVVPTGIDSVVAESMHRTTYGVDADPVNLLLGAIKCALADYAGCHLATDLADILFGTPQPAVTSANLGVLKKNAVNIAVHGHNPLLSDMIAQVADDKGAERQGQGCRRFGRDQRRRRLLHRERSDDAPQDPAGNKLRVPGDRDPDRRPGRHGRRLPVHHALPRERGRVLSHQAHHHHVHRKDTRRPCISSSRRRTPGNRQRRSSSPRSKRSRSATRRRSTSPTISSPAIVGFSTETIVGALAKVNKEDPLKPLIDNIVSGNIYGVCLFAGCNTVKVTQDANYVAMIKELAKNNVLILATGCASGAFARHGFMTPEATNKYAGPGLKAVLTAVGQAAGLGGPLPLVLHMGSCVDNSRAADVAVAVANKLGVDLNKLPVVASAPEAVTEKAVAIGTWAVAAGLPTHLGVVPPVLGSKVVTQVLTSTAKDLFGG